MVCGTSRSGSVRTGLVGARHLAARNLDELGDADVDGNDVGSRETDGVGGVGEQLQQRLLGGHPPAHRGRHDVVDAGRIDHHLDAGGGLKAAKPVGERARRESSKVRTCWPSAFGPPTDGRPTAATCARGALPRWRRDQARSTRRRPRPPSSASNERAWPTMVPSALKSSGGMSWNDRKYFGGRAMMASLLRGARHGLDTIGPAGRVTAPRV